MKAVCQTYFEAGAAACLDCPLAKKGCGQDGFVPSRIEGDEDFVQAVANHLGLRAREVSSPKEGVRRFELR